MRAAIRNQRELVHASAMAAALGAAVFARPVLAQVRDDRVPSGGDVRESVPPIVVTAEAPWSQTPRSWPPALVDAPSQPIYWAVPQAPPRYAWPPDRRRGYRTRAAMSPAEQEEWRRAHAGRTLLNTGTALQVVSALGALAYGLEMLGRPRDVQHEIGGFALIPYAGPFIAAAAIGTTTLLNRELAMGVMVVDGLVQIAATAMRIVGRVRRASARMPAASPSAQRPVAWTLVPWGGGGQALSAALKAPRARKRAEATAVASSSPSIYAAPRLR